MIIKKLKILMIVLVEKMRLRVHVFIQTCKDIPNSYLDQEHKDFYLATVKEC